MSAAADLVSLINSGTMQGVHARRIRALMPRLSAKNILALTELVGELAETNHLHAGGTVTHPRGARIAVGYTAYGNGLVSHDANGDIASVELTVPIDAIEVVA